MKLLSKVLPQIQGRSASAWQLYVVFALVLAPLLAAFSFAVLPTPNAHALPMQGPYPINEGGATGTTAQVSYTVYQPGDTVSNPGICPKATNLTAAGTEPANIWCYTIIVANNPSTQAINQFQSALSTGVTFYDVGYDLTNATDVPPTAVTFNGSVTPGSNGTGPATLVANSTTVQFAFGAAGNLPINRQSVTLYFEANKSPGASNGTFSDNSGSSGNGYLPGFTAVLDEIAAETKPLPGDAPTTISGKKGLNNGFNTGSVAPQDHPEIVLTVAPGGGYNYTIYFTNPATGPALSVNNTTINDVKVTNLLPTDITANAGQTATYVVSNPSNPGALPTQSNATESIGSTSQTFNSYNIPPGGQVAITFRVTLDPINPLNKQIYFITPQSTFGSTTEGMTSALIAGSGPLSGGRYGGPQALDIPVTDPTNPTGGCDLKNYPNNNSCKNLFNNFTNNGTGTAAPIVVSTTGNGVVTGLQTNAATLSLQASVGSTTSVQKSLTLSNGQNSSNWASSISYGAGANGWLSLSPASGVLAGFNSTNLTFSANPTGLAANTYTANVTFADANTASNSVTTAVSLIVGNGGAYTYYLPSVANKANGFTSSIIVQNLGSAAATLTSQYYDTAGNSLGTQSVASSIAPNTSITLANALANGAHGTGFLSSNQPLAVLVQESTPFGSSAYAVSAGTASTLVAPLAINNSGGFATQLTVANGAAAATTALVKFYDLSGNLVAGATRTLNLPAHGSQTLDQTAADSGLASGYYGWARIEGATGSQLTAQVLEQRADIKFVALANAQVVSASSSIYAPAIFRGAFNGFVTGANIVNPNNNPVQVSITYYASTGQAYAAAPFTLAANGVAAVYQGDVSGNGIPAGGLPNGFYGSATVSTSGGSVAMVVNEAGSQTQNGAAQSGTYAAASNGASNLGLAVMANGANGYVTGATILNTSNGAVSGSLTYYNQSGATVATQSFTIGAHASLPVYQGAGNLPAGFSGSAVVTQANGAAGSLLATTNAQSPDLFYTYTSN